MLNRGLDKQELLRIVEAVANEKSIDKEIVIGSMESAIQKAALTKFGADNNIEVIIDRISGDIKIQKVLDIVESVEDPAREITLDDAKKRASEIIKISEDLIDLSFETDHYFVFTGHVEVKKLFSKKNQHHILILDRYGKMKLSLKNAKIFQGGKITVLEELDDFLESRHSDIAPKIFLLNDLKLIDYSSLTSASKIIDGVRLELENSEKAAILVELWLGRNFV